MGITCGKRLKSSSKIDDFENISSTPLIIQSSSTESLPNGITLIWLDEHAGKSFAEDEKNTLFHLRQLNVASIRIFNDINSCLDFLKSLSYDKNNQHSKIFLIVSGTLSTKILFELKIFPIIDLVFIFCMHRSKYKQLMEEYKLLIIDICTNIHDLCHSINKQIEEFNQLTLVVHFFSQNQNTTRNLMKDSASFLWFQLFQIKISELKCTEYEKNLMLDYCTKQVQNNQKQIHMLSEIEEFRLTYESKHAIHWYTKESFIYRLLNTALRTENFEGLYIFRYFIADICRQLKVEHKKLRIKQSQSPILRLYRGGRISCEEFENLKESIKNLISLNGFISTSKSQNVAMQFLRKPKSRKDNAENVLFIIDVDIRSEHIICADIEKMSEHQDEEEILFNIGTVFYIDQIIFNSNEQVWNLYMKATEDGIKAAYDYINLIHKELTDTNVSIIFGQLFLQIGDYLMAQKYFLDLYNCPSRNDSDLPNIYYHLALTYGYQDDLKQAEDYLKKVEEYHIRNQSKNLDFARTKNALGWIYHRSGDLDQAIIYYEQALIFAPDQSDRKHLINAQTYSLLGDCYLEKDELDDAEKCYKEALEIEEQLLLTNHPRIGVTFNDLGNVFRRRMDMKKALEYYEQAEKIFHKTLTNYHPNIAYCWSCMAFVYLYEGQIEKAQKYHEQALKIYRRVLPSDHNNIKISEKNSKCTDFQKINDTYVKICAQV